MENGLTLKLNNQPLVFNYDSLKEIKPANEGGSLINTGSEIYIEVKEDTEEIFQIIKNGFTQ